MPTPHVHLRSRAVAVVALGLSASGVLAQRMVIESPVRALDPNDQGQFTRVSVDIEALRVLCTGETTVVRHFPIGRGRTVEIEIEPFEIFASDAAVVIGTAAGDVQVERPDVVLLRGRVAGDDESAVFLGVSPLMVHGSIKMKGETFYVSSGPWNGAGEVVVCAAADMPPGAALPVIPCGTAPFGGGHEPGGGGPGGAGASGMAPRGGFACRHIRVALDTLWEHSRDLFGGDPHATLTYDTMLMAAVSEIYHRDFNLHISVPFIRAWADNSDPYDLAAGDILAQFRNHWAPNMRHVSRTLAHVLTPSGLNGAGGLAWGRTVCNNDWGYSAAAYLSGSFPYPLVDHHFGTWDLVVVAHEIGHNLGSPHTHDYNPPIDRCGHGDCSQAFGGTIMSYCHTCPGGMVNIALHFDERNLATMNEYLLEAGGGCPFENLAAPTADFTSTLGTKPAVIDVLANDNVGGCAAWTIASFNGTSVNNGTVARSVGTGPDGRDELVYNAPTRFSGIDRFSYTVMAPGRGTQTVNVSVRVVGGRAPVLVARPTHGVDVSYYALTNPQALPDFSALKPIVTSTAPSVAFHPTNGNFGDSGRSDDVGAVFTGFINVPASADYTLSLESDDGSRLFIGDELVVNNDGLHGMTERIGRIPLDAGMHPIRVEFFEAGATAGCIVRWESDTIFLQEIPPANWFRGELCTVDWNASGTLNSQDFFDFMASFFEDAADFNRSGATNSQDFFDFLTAFFEGC